MLPSVRHSLLVAFFYYNLSILQGWKTDYPATKLEFMSLLIYTSTLVYKCSCMITLKDLAISLNTAFFIASRERIVWKLQL